eukprot:4139841-Amphidinium_carterae.1
MLESEPAKSESTCGGAGGAAAGAGAPLQAWCVWLVVPSGQTTDVVWSSPGASTPRRDVPS